MTFIFKLPCRGLSTAGHSPEIYKHESNLQIASQTCRLLPKVNSFREIGLLPFVFRINENFQVCRTGYFVSLQFSACDAAISHENRESGHLFSFLLLVSVGFRWFPWVWVSHVPPPPFFFWQEVAYLVNLLFQKLAIFLLFRDICSEWVFIWYQRHSHPSARWKSYGVYSSYLYGSVNFILP